MIHNYYKHRGGEGISFAAEAEALRALGHVVDTFSLDNAVDLEKRNRIQTAINSIWSRESYNTVRSLLQNKSYDVLHVQNFFPLLSPSVYDAAKSCGVPVVQALRNYRLFCMQTGLFRDGKICESCSGGKHSWAGIKHRCYRDSLGASLTLSVMIEFHRLRNTWANRVDAFVAVSDCVKQKYVSNGWNPNQIRVKHNTVSPAPDIGKGEQGNFVVVGRLSEDKGLLVLLDAWEILMQQCSPEDIPLLKVIGDGPLEQTLRDDVVRRGLSDCVVIVGRLLLEATYTELGNALASIQPSVRFEPCSRTIAESYAKGTPVIAAKIGGTVELVSDGVSGFHFEPGDASALAEIVYRLWKDPKIALSMRATARKFFDDKFSPQKNAEQLVSIYEAVINHAGSCIGNV
ncbi:MAG: glycosyltransferase [Pontiella sp.]